MPDIKFRAPDGSNLSLPDFLFYTPKKKSKSIPPHAIFDPSAAISGKAWSSSTAPSSKPEKRSIIIDNSSFPDLPPIADFLAFVTFLKNSGFEIYLRVAGSEPFLKVGDDIKNFSNLLQEIELKKFNPEKDYAKIDVARDKLVFLDRAKKLEIYESQKRNFAFDSSFAMEKLAREKVFTRLDRSTFDHALSSHFLSYCSEKEAEEFIKKYWKHFTRIYPSCYKTQKRVKLLIEIFSADTAVPLLNIGDMPEKILELLSEKNAEENRDSIVKFIIKNVESFSNSRELHSIIKKLPKTDAKKIVEKALRHVRKDDFFRFQKISLLLLISNEEETAALLKEIRNGSPPNHDSLGSFIECLKIIPRQNFSEFFEFGRATPIFGYLEDVLKNCPEHSREIIESFLSASYDDRSFVFYDAPLFLENAPTDLKAKVVQKFAQSFKDRLHRGCEATQMHPLDLSKKYDQLLFSELRKILSNYLIEEKLPYLPHYFAAFPEKAGSFLRQEPLMKKFYDSTRGIKLPANYIKPFLQILLKSRSKPLAISDLHRLRYFAGPDFVSMVETASGEFELPRNLPSFAINPTHFQIENFNGNAFDILKTWKEHFSKVAVLNIFEITVSDSGPEVGLEMLKTLFPNLVHLVLPKSFPKAFIPKGYSYEFSNYQREDYSHYIMLAPDRAPPSDRRLFVAPNTVEKKMTTTSGETESCTANKAGEILNPNAASSASIRTLIIKRDILKNLDQHEYVPKKFKAVTLTPEQNLTERQINELKARGSEKTFYRFNLQLSAGIRTRLLSASASEELFGITADNDAEIKIEKGDDDFLYVTAAEDCSFSHVVAVNAVTPELPRGSLARRIIDEYKSHPYTEVATEESIGTPDYDLMPHEEWMKEVFTKKLGSCRHRVAAVEYALRKAEIEEKNLRVVNINGNHVVLEVREGGVWHSIDLGGAATEVIKSKEENYHPPKLEVTPTPSVSIVAIEAASTVSAASGAAIATTTLQKSFNQMKCAFKKLSTLHQVKNEEDLELEIGKKKKVLIVTSNVDGHSNHLLAQAHERKVFYIDSPAKIDIAIKNLFLPETGDPIIRDVGLLEGFLDGGEEERKVAENKFPLLIINWDAFTPSDRVALNSLLDERDRRIHEREIPDQTQIISLCSSTPKDLSFLSRHDLSLSSEISFSTKSLTSEREAIEIDLQGFPDWRSYFFGRVVLKDEKMEWEKSKFVEALERGSENFIIKNISDEAAEELHYELAQAKALGHFKYHGHYLFLPENFTLDCKANVFDFSKFIVPIKSNVTYDQAPKDCVLINGYLFDQLLQRTEIIDGEYHEIHGLIREKSDEILKIFISEDLSESQWYCLLNQADGDTGLRIYLAPNVKIPAGIDVCEIGVDVREIDFDGGEEESKASADPAKPKICISNNADKTARLLASAGDYYAIINVEDLSYQDLCFATNFDLDGNNFRNFRKNKSQFLESLEARKKIVLKGKFAPDLLQMLHPLLVGEYPNLTVIIEDESLISPSFLAEKNCEIRDEKEARKSPAENYHEILDRSKLDADSERKSDEFIAARKSKFVEMLDTSNLLQLVGHSGVGKSRLMKMFEEEGQFKIHREMKNFEEWAKNDGDGKVKILFIDESNIEDMHFTTFSPLKAGSNRRILYQGKFYDLDETHKVVFACNPKEYGGGRFDQKLFEDGSIPQMHLQDFPASYIYEKILKESIYDKLAEEVKKEIPEEKFKENCRIFVEKYQALNEANQSVTEALTVRELQEQVLESLLEKQEFKKIKSKNFTSTEATKDAELALDSILRIRQKQREGKFPNHTIGINGILFEGDSGTGKSEMIRATLEDRKIKYHKINAKMDLAQKTKIILEAAEEGETVWIDELNSCIDDGLEKILNAVLTGINPETGEKLSKPGFTLVASINQISDEGRSKISPALMHRLHHQKMKSLREYSRDDLAEIVGSWIGEGSVAEEIAEDFHDLLAEGSGVAPNLRMLRAVYGEVPSVDVGSAEAGIVGGDHCGRPRDGTRPAPTKN